MDDETMKTGWDDFARSIGGTVHMSRENYSDHNNYYKINTDKSEIELIWGNQPQKGRGPYITLESKIRFKLNENNSVTLKVRPKDFLSTIFTSKKQKFGVKELDNSYSLSSNSDGLIFTLTDIFKEFYKNNRYKNFIIETETITDTPTLTIFIPELITTKSKLAFYYNFGLKISKILDDDTST